MKKKRYNNSSRFSFTSLFFPLTTKKAVIVIFVLGTIVYLNMLFNGFVWDDFPYIIDNPNAYGINVLYAFGSNLFNTTGQYRPIPELYYSILATFFGNTPFVYHYLQLLIHLGGTIAVFFLFKKYFPKGLSLFLALLFLVHPINVESVSFVAQTPLYFVFGILAILLATDKKISLSSTCYLLLLMLLSVWSKETGALFIIMAILYRVLFSLNGRIRLLVGSVVTIVIYGLFRFQIGHVGLTSQQLIPVESQSLFWRIYTVPVIFLYYIKTLIFPLNLAIDQRWTIDSLTASTFYIPVCIDSIFLLGSVWIGYSLYRRDLYFFRLYIFFSIWFVLGFLSISQIFRLDMTVADRWFYFPMVGLLGMIGVIYSIFISKLNVKKSYLVEAAIVIVVFLSVRTMIRNSDWQNVFTLYNHDSMISDNYDIENNLGFEYINIGDYKDAIIHIKKSIAEKPIETNYQDLGDAYELMGESTNAQKYYVLAFEAKSYNQYYPHKHDVATYRDYGHLLIMTKQSQKAEVFLTKALNDYPMDSVLWFYLALSNTQLHQKKEALVALIRAHRLDPTNQLIGTVYVDIVKGKAFSLNMDSTKITFD